MWPSDRGREAANQDGACGSRWQALELAAAQYTGTQRNPVTQYVKLLTPNPLTGCSLFTDSPGRRTREMEAV